MDSPRNHPALGFPGAATVAAAAVAGTRQQLPVAGGSAASKATGSRGPDEFS